MDGAYADANEAERREKIAIEALNDAERRLGLATEDGERLRGLMEASASVASAARAEADAARSEVDRLVA